MSSTRPFLQAALNGGRKPGSAANLPATPEALAREAAAAIAAGADTVHLHVRAPGGLESVAAEDVARTLAAVREAVPGVPVGISTGLWIVRSAEVRMRLVRAWTTLPDYASVNFHEDGAAELAAHLLERGVQVEAGVPTVEATRILLSTGLASRCVRMLIEPVEQDVAQASATVRGIEDELDRAGVEAPRIVHGLKATAWPLLADAARRGRAMRIGMEDTVALPDGSPAEGNGPLVAAARRIIAGARPGD